MGPNINDVEVNIKIEDTVIQAALPFNKANYQQAEEIVEKDAETPEVVANEPSTSEDSEEADPLRISTRARHTYELDRYSKNAMLIFEGNSSDSFQYSDEENAPQPDDMSTKFKQTFERYRFEVEIHRDLNDEEIASTCDRFFQRDFTEYGCVAIMMLAKTRAGIVESTHTPKTEFGVVRYMSDLMPPTLQGKPKIYIVQTEGYYVIPRARVWPTLPQDNLEFRVVVPLVSAPDARGRRSKVCCFLEYVHHKIDTLADQTDLHSILCDAIHEFARSNFLDALTIPGFYSSLTKELRLVRTPEL